MLKIERGKNLTKTLTLIALFTALIVVGGFVRFPIGVVPITLQTLFVLLAGAVGGKKVGVCAVAVYLVLGLIGLPVFALGGGIFYIFKPTFGYLIGFIFLALVGGINCKKLWAKISLNFVGILITHVVGVAYLYLISNFYLATHISIGEAITVGSLTFLPSDVLFAIISAILSFKLKRIIKKA